MILWIKLLGWAAAGAFLWTFAEYAIHNWLGHLGRGRNSFSREHLKHHADGNYFTPNYKKARTAAAIVIPAGAALIPIFGLSGLASVLGFSAMYVAYEMLHRRIHTHAPRGWYGRMVRKHHLSHHFSNPRMNHGVTSPIWDFVFRTYQKPGRIRVPAKQAMVWLRDPDGRVPPRLERDYLLWERA